MTKQTITLPEENENFELFDEETFERIKSQHPLIAIQNLIDQLIEFIQIRDPEMSEDKRFEVIIKSFTFIHVLAQKYKVAAQELGPTGNIKNDIVNCVKILNTMKISAIQVYTKEIANGASERFGGLFNDEAIYEFEDDELDTLTKKLAEIRNILQRSDYFEENHKFRLLKLLERLQSEVHKKMSDLSRFYGAFVEFGVVLGKFGKESKPMFDRISDVIKIVGGVQTRTNNVEPKLISKIFSSNVLEEGEE